jgi:hypothetical protein
MYASEDSGVEETVNVEDLARRVRLSVDRSHQQGLRLIDIEVVGDTVVLSGHVGTFHLKQLATAFACKVAGVVDVVNRLEVHNGRNDVCLLESKCYLLQKCYPLESRRLAMSSEGPHELVRLAAAANPFQAHIWQQALKNEGIRCQVLGDYLDADIGDIPGIRAEVWVTVADLARAEAFLRQHRDHSEEASSPQQRRSVP